MSQSKLIETGARILAVMSFVTICFVAHRTMKTRTQCLNSSFIAFAQFGDQRVMNCQFESRLNLNSIFHPLPQEKEQALRRLEVIEPLAGLFPDARPQLAVDVRFDQPRVFELGLGFVRIGSDWLSDTVQTQRALIMGLLRRQQPRKYANNFELEVMTDFLLKTVLREDDWSGHSYSEDVKLPTSAPSFEEYCKSPFRSLAHYDACASAEPDSGDLQANVWGFRPLLAEALSRVFEKSGLREKLKIMNLVRSTRSLPVTDAARDTTLASLIPWFLQTLQEHLNSMGFNKDSDTAWNVKSALKELEIESPIHWELTVDITHTPAWKEILDQFRSWSHYHPQERTLVFTPDGAVAFPSGLPVAWTPDQIRSQTHVLIACGWPKPKDAISVEARHVFARRSCGKVDEVFWN